MTILGRKAILEADDLPTEDVKVPEWGGSVRIRAMTALEAQKLANELASGDDTMLRMRLVQLCAVDEEGRPLFTQDDLEKLGAKNFNAIRRVSEACFRMNRYRRQDVVEAAENFD